ncbi:hypothetical protein [Deinococcus frigens]|uniref:hypothetical protein n=1 Tax=Deinococcus frigens TaxID=249403 RepID=UPI001B80CA73|nr:hypothetical protein [Deinococcus frigens]
MEQLAHHLAREARRLGLESADLGNAADAVQAFAQAVLTEVAALGLIWGAEEVGCWAAPRSGGHCSDGNCFRWALKTEKKPPHWEAGKFVKDYA